MGFRAELGKINYAKIRKITRRFAKLALAPVVEGSSNGSFSLLFVELRVIFQIFA